MDKVIAATLREGDARHRIFDLCCNPSLEGARELHIRTIHIAKEFLEFIESHAWSVPRFPHFPRKDQDYLISRTVSVAEATGRYLRVRGFIAAFVRGTTKS